MKMDNAFEKAIRRVNDMVTAGTIDKMEAVSLRAELKKKESEYLDPTNAGNMNAMDEKQARVAIHNIFNRED